VERAPEPDDVDELDLILAWLAFHRDALAAKCEGVDDDDLVRAGLGGSALSLLGLVRHLTEMERVYLVYGIGGGEFSFVYGPYEEGEPAGDFDRLTPDMVEGSFEAWHSERRTADALIAAAGSPAARGGNGRSLRWNLVKVVQEYARHNGHADLIRESIDGATGE
jgi:Protein of unknown function (DUF664)